MKSLANLVPPGYMSQEPNVGQVIANVCLGDDSPHDRCELIDACNSTADVDCVDGRVQPSLGTPPTP